MPTTFNKFLNTHYKYQIAATVLFISQPCRQPPETGPAPPAAKHSRHKEAFLQSAHTVCAKRPIVGKLSRDHPENHPPPGELRPKGKSSRFIAVLASAPDGKGASVLLLAGMGMIVTEFFCWGQGGGGCSEGAKMTK